MRALLHPPALRQVDPAGDQRCPSAGFHGRRWSWAVAMSTTIVGERFLIYACKARKPKIACANLVGWPNAGQDAAGVDDRTGGAGFDAAHDGAKAFGRAFNLRFLIAGHLVAPECLASVPAFRSTARRFDWCQQCARADRRDIAPRSSRAPDARRRLRFLLMDRFCFENLHSWDYSSRIKSGVTSSGKRSRARAVMIVKWVRLFGLARCF